VCVIGNNSVILS